MSNNLINIEDMFELYRSGKLEGEKIHELSQQLANDKQMAQEFELYCTLKNNLDDIRIEQENKLINSHYQKKLTENEKRDFGQRLEYDKNFKQKAELYSNFKSSFDKEQQSNLSIVYRNYQKRKKIVYAAAVVIALLLVGQFYLRTSFKPGNTKFIAEHVSKKQTIPVENNIEENIENRTGEEISQPDVEVTKEKVKSKVIPEVVQEQPDLKSVLAKYLNLIKNNKETTLLAVAESEEFELPPSFVENETLDARVKTNFRFTKNINIVTPEKFQISKNPVVFEWAKIQGDVSIIVRDNQRNEVWSYSTSNDYKISCDKNLAAGTYYWVIKVKHEKINEQLIRQFFIVE